MNKFVYFIDTELFIYTVETQATYLFADAASEPEASEQVSSSNSYWALKVRFYFRFSDQNALR